MGHPAHIIETDAVDPEWENHYGQDATELETTRNTLQVAMNIIADQNFQHKPSEDIQGCISDNLSDLISDIDGTLTQLSEKRP